MGFNSEPGGEPGGSGGESGGEPGGEPGGSISPLNFDVDALVEMSKGQSKINNQTRREGLVFKSVEYIEDPKLGRLSFKVINPDFLIKYGE